MEIWRLWSDEQVSGKILAWVVCVHSCFDYLHFLIFTRLSLLCTSRPRRIPLRYIFLKLVALFLISRVAAFCVAYLSLEFYDHILSQNRTDFVNNCTFPFLIFFYFLDQPFLVAFSKRFSQLIRDLEHLFIDFNQEWFDLNPQFAFKWSLQISGAALQITLQSSQLFNLHLQLSFYHCEHLYRVFGQVADFLHLN